MSGMCPHCGRIVRLSSGHLTYLHIDDSGVGDCPGSRQNPRCAESDRRPLWNGKPNPHIAPKEGRDEQ